MRWTLVTETYPPEVNGVAMTLQRLVTTLAAGGHEVSVVRPRQAADRQALRQAGSAVLQAAGNTDGDAAAQENRGVVTQRAGSADVPHSTQTVRTDFVLGLPIPGYRGLLLGRMATRKLTRLWRASRPDAVHIATEGPLGLSALLAAQRLGIPVVTTFHTNFHSYGEHYGLGVFKKPLMAYLRWFHNRSLATFAPSADVLAQLEAQGLERLYLMGRGVDTRLFGRHRRSEALRRSWGVAEEGGAVASVVRSQQQAHPAADAYIAATTDSAGAGICAEPVVLYAGRVAAEKNLPLAIEAFEHLRTRIPGARMVIVGDGPLRERLQRQYPHIHFAGMRHGEDLAAHYASADLFFFASVTETFGNVITEAMASSLVVLSYNYAAAARYIEDGVSGFTAAFDDRASLFAAVDRLAENSAQWPVIRSAAAAAVTDLSWERIAAGYMGSTAQIVAEQGGSVIGKN